MAGGFGYNGRYARLLRIADNIAKLNEKCPGCHERPGLVIQFENAANQPERRLAARAHHSTIAGEGQCRRARDEVRRIGANISKLLVDWVRTTRPIA